MNKNNIDDRTVASFGDEWSRFDQTRMTKSESRKVFNEYFAIFPWSSLSSNAIGFDMGCGSGRWAEYVAPKVGQLNCIDPSTAIEVAKRRLINHRNIHFYQAAIDTIDLPASSQDFGYSLGVLHHVPDTAAAIRSCVSLLKPGAPLLLYLYYAFDNRPCWFHLLWKFSDLGRRVICRFPASLKNLVTDLIATFVYWPFAMLSRFAERTELNIDCIPLSYYRNHSFYTMRTDARDRFGTPIERRFTRLQIRNMMEDAGLVGIQFSKEPPFWCCVGFKHK